MKVNSFIKNAAALYRSTSSNSCTKFTAILGNQSADLDSIVSSISLSYYLNKKNNSTHFIPVINSSQRILQSKKECRFMFNCFSIDLNDFVFIAEWDTNKIENVILVDHNEPDDQEKKLGIDQIVDGLIDHHLDKGEFLNASPRIVDQTAGSNSSLITQNFICKLDKTELDQTLADMLLFPILSDTNNLTTRTSQIDIDSVKFLSEFTSLDCEKMYKQLEKVKFENDLNEDLSLVMLKDYKQYETHAKRWGISSVNFSLADWLNTPNLDQCLEKVNLFMRENHLSVYAILSCFKLDDDSSVEFKRDFILFGNRSLLEKFTDLNCSLMKIEYVKSEFAFNSYALYNVSDVKYTRKYWQPSLENYLKNVF